MFSLVNNNYALIKIQHNTYYLLIMRKCRIDSLHQS